MPLSDEALRVLRLIDQVSESGKRSSIMLKELMDADNTTVINTVAAGLSELAHKGYLTISGDPLLITLGEKYNDTRG